MEKASSARNGDRFKKLWGGDHSAYPSASEADLALAGMLAFWTGPDPARIESLMLQSGLKREKWTNHKTYLRDTVARALEGKTEFYGMTAAPSPETRMLDVRFAFTDTGNAERFRALHGDRARYCFPWGKWLVWDGRRWAIDQTGAAEQLAKETARSVLRNAAEVEDKTTRDKLVGWARKSESAASRAAMLKLAQSEPGIPVMPDDLDRNPFLFNVENGTLDLRTGRLRPHDKKDNLTKLAPVVFDSAATCPTFERFIAEIFSGDADLIRFVQRWLGYCMSGDVGEQIFTIWYGTGANGKSTLLGVVLDVLGLDYSLKAPADLLIVKRGAEHPTALTDLYGRRLVACVETSEGGRLAESLTKELTGGDAIRARRMREDYWQFLPSHKVVLACNHKPAVKDTGHAMWRRIRLVPFDVVISAERRDKQLPAKLAAERSGILNWLLAGCLAWQRDGLGEPPAVVAATADYAAAEDVLGNFVSECCVQGDVAVRAADLVSAYIEWGGDRSMTVRKMTRLLTEMGVQKYKNSGVWYRGIGLGHGTNGTFTGETERFAR